jgi:hypothetical protein
MVVTLHSMISFPVSSRRSLSLALTALMPLLAGFAGCGGSGDSVSGGPITGTAAGSGGTAAVGQPGAATSGSGAAAAGTTSTTGAAGTTTTKPPGAAGSSLSVAGASGAAGVGATAGTPAAIGGAPATPTAGTGGIAGAAGTATPMAGSGGTQPPALTDADTLVPHASWDCGMPAGIPGPASGELAFEATLTLGEVYDLGDTQFGRRLLIEITGGTLKGPEIDATFMDRGLDWQLTLPNGAVEVEQVNILKTSDGTNIYFRNCGTAAGPGDVRIVPDFEAPTSSRYAWLNTTKLAGTRTFDAATKKLTMRVFKLAAQPAAGGAMLKVEEPTGLPDQTWECKQPMGRQAGVMYTESVGIGGGSVSVGASKRGSRNIIPITGGTTEGRIEGGVLSGGADFQLSAGGEFILDARYTLKTKEGELIIVRNCGPIGALVPVFEAKASGPYAWVNANTWLSSDPSIGPGVVNLTIYETN